IYDADPVKVPNAKLYKEIAYMDVLSQPLREYVHVSDLLIQLSIRHFDRIGIVNPIDFCGFENDFGLDLHGTESGRRVRRKVRIARTSRKNDDPSFLQVADGATANIHFGDLAHLDGREHPGVDVHLFESVLDGQSVDNGGE